MRLERAGLAFVLLAASAAVFAQEPGSATRGQAKFEHSCAPCHGDGIGDDGRAMLPGTDTLRIKHQGSLPALVGLLTDLNAETIRTFVRRGTWSMPPYRPREVTDQDIQDLAAYLRKR